jgi:putative transposase
MSYSLDLRTKVVNFIENGHSMAEAAKTFGISRATIYRWLKRTELAPTKVTTRKRKVDIVALAKDVERDPSTSLKERAKRFGVTPAALCYRFKKMKITRKKNSYAIKKGIPKRGLPTISA